MLRVLSLPLSPALSDVAGRVCFLPALGASACRESSNPHKAAELYDEAAKGNSHSAVIAKFELAQLLEVRSLESAESVCRL